MLYLAAEAAGWEISGAVGVPGLERAVDDFAAGDVVHVHWTAPITRGADTEAAAMAKATEFERLLERARARGIHVLWTVHNEVAHDTAFLTAELAINAALARWATRIIQLHDHTAPFLAPDTVLPPERTVTLRHSSYAGIYPELPSVHDARASIGCPDGVPTVGLIGQLRPYKGVDVLLEAAGIAARELEDLTVLLAGRTEPEQVEQISEMLPEGVRVIRHHEFLDDADIAAWFQASDVVALPYHRILNSGSALLAATLGRPVALPDDTPLSEVYAGQQWVEFFDGSDASAQSLADAIVRAWRNREAGSQAARAFAAEYSPYDMSRDFLRLLDELGGAVPPTPVATPDTPDAPDVSVVMPTYNVGPWIEECLSSLLDDQGVALEVIAVDDGSTDDTMARLEARAAHDPRLRIVRNPGKGGAEARNHGATLARAPYLAFVDSDDLVPRGAYLSMLDAMRAAPADMVVGSFLKFFPNRTWRPTRPWEAFEEPRTGITLLDHPSLIRNRACWNRLFDTAFWRDQAIEFPTVPRSNDVVPMTRALVGARAINVVTDTVYLYRSRPGTGSMTSRAHGVDAVVSYLTQERSSLEATAALGDTGMTAMHRELYLAADGWVHLRSFLVGPGFSLCSDDELEAVRRALRAVDELAPVEQAEGLGWGPTWGFRLALAGRWQDAHLVATTLEGEPDPERALELLGRLRAEAAYGDDDLRSLADDLLFRPILAREEPAPDTLVPLLRGRDLLVALYPEPGERSRSAAHQHLLQAVHHGDERVLAEVLGDLPVRFALRRVVDRPDGVALRIAHFGPRPSQLQFELHEGDGVRALVTRESGDEAVSSAYVPSGLTRGPREVRVRATIAGLPVDAPVALAPFAPASAVVRRRRYLLSTLEGPGSRAVLTIGPGFSRRVASRLRRELARR